MPEHLIRLKFEEREKIYPAIMLYMGENKLPLIDAYLKSQILLPKNRRRPRGNLRRPQLQSEYARHLKDRASRGLDAWPTMAELEAKQAEAKPKKVKAYTSKVNPLIVNLPAEKRQPSRHKMRWTTAQEAAIAQEVIRLQSDGETRLARDGKPWRDWHFVCQAQANIFPVELHRTHNSINVASVTGELAKTLARGKSNIWLLEKESPADEDTSPYMGPLPEIEDALAAPDGGDSVRLNPVVSATDETPMGAASPLPAPSGGGYLAQLQNGFESLLRVHASYILQEQLKPLIREEIAQFEMRVLLAVRQIKDETDLKLDQRIHALFEKELGYATTPAPVVHVKEAKPPEIVSRPSKLALDVVGLLPGQARIVEKELPAYMDVRFIGADEALKVVPRKTVISVTKFISHPVETRYKNANAELIRVNGAAQSVIAAIKQLENRNNTN